MFRKITRHTVLPFIRTSWKRHKDYVTDRTPFRKHVNSALNLIGEKSALGEIYFLVDCLFATNKLKPSV